MLFLEIAIDAVNVEVLSTGNNPEPPETDKLSTVASAILLFAFWKATAGENEAHTMRGLVIDVEFENEPGVYTISPVFNRLN